MRKLFNCAIIGHFGFKKESLDGQTIKTINVSNELDRVYGSENVFKIDTHGGLFSILFLFIKIAYSIKRTDNIVFLLANRGVRIIVPFLLFLNKNHSKKIHYIVIGGWLPNLCLRKKRLSNKLKDIDWIYVETFEMKHRMDEQGFSNVLVLPNFKRLSPISKSELRTQNKAPYSLCTFSRVMKEKGIEDAAKAIDLINKKNGRVLYLLDVYGQVDTKQKKWFDALLKSFGNSVVYKGAVNPNESVATLKNYYALLFPTFYDGEGFAGTIIDAMAAGVPTIASDWKYNREIINGNNGVLFPVHNIEALADAILNLNISREKCLEEYQKYCPENVIDVLIKHFI